MTRLIPLALGYLVLSACAVGGPSVPAGQVCITEQFVVTDDFVGARRGSCAVLGADHVRVTIRPEDDGYVNDSPWYAFRIDPVRTGEATITVGYEGGHHRYWPKISTDALSWSPLAEDQVNISPDGSSMTVTVQLGDDEVWLAAQELITPAIYNDWNRKIAATTGAPLAVLGQSRAGQHIHYFDSNPGNKDVLLLVGRQHPPEVTGVFAMLAFTETVLGESELARAFRQAFRVIVIPMLNPDGVAAGNWRHNLGGVDLNRDWGPFTQPETQLVRDLLIELEENGHELRAFVDFHSTKRNLFYTQTDDYPTDPPGFYRTWLENARARISGYPFTNEAGPVSEQANSKNYMFKRYGIPAVTYEVGDQADRNETRAAAVIFAEELMKLLLGRSGPPSDYDILIKGGIVYDGTLNEPQRADIAVRDGRILAIGPNLDGTASRIIEAGGKLVMPGFIDPHTHATSTLKSANSNANLNYLTQGVSTVVIGNDGFGVEDFDATLAHMDLQGVGTNVVPLSGHGAIRTSVMGLADRAPNEAEMAAMQAMLLREMENGSFGLSTGLFYAPGSFADTAEVVELARVAAISGGIYETHLRSEGAYGDGLLAAIDESIEIGRSAGIPVHISHLKALGKPVWGQSTDIIQRVDAARAEGIDVTANQYPWQASGTRFSSALIPRWAAADSKQRMIERLADAETGPAIRDEMRVNLDIRGGPDAMLVTAADSPWRGRTLAEIATQLGLDPIEAALQVAIDHDPSIASFVMNPDDIAAIAAQPWVMTGSDGSAGHPRLYGSYPKAWQDLVQSGAMSVPAFVHRSTGLVAETFNLCNRGFLREDYVADIAVIDADAFTSNATYEAPTELSSGVTHLLVNGVVVITDSHYNDYLPGQVLRRNQCDD